MSARLGVVLDACVLAPMPLADTLLRLAELQMFQPYWSERILSETVGAIVDIGHSQDDAEWRVGAMRRTFSDAMIVTVPLQVPLDLPDPDDDHVLQVAIASPATVILTHNLRDFPAEVCDRYQVEVKSPDDFLSEQFRLHPREIGDMLVRQANALRNPAVTVGRLLTGLRRDAPEFVREAARLLMERGEL